MSRNLNLKKTLILASLSAILTIIDHPMAIAVNESNSDLCNALFTGSTGVEMYITSNAPPVNGFLRHGPEAITMFLTIGDKSSAMDSDAAEKLIGELTGMTRVADTDLLRDPFGDPATRAATHTRYNLANIFNETASELHTIALSNTAYEGNITKRSFGNSPGPKTLRQLETALNMVLDPRLQATVRIEFPRTRRRTIPNPQGYHLRITIGMGAPDNVRSEQTEQILRALGAFSYSILSHKEIVALANSPIMRGLHAINWNDGYVLTGVREAPRNHFFSPTGQLIKSLSSDLRTVELQLTYMPVMTKPPTNWKSTKPPRFAYLRVAQGPDGALYVRNALGNLPSEIMEGVVGISAVHPRLLFWGAPDLKSLLYQAPTTR